MEGVCVCVHRTRTEQRRRSVGLLEATAPPELLPSFMDPLIGHCREDEETINH